MLTTAEVDQYIRLTLKQWGLDHLKIEWSGMKCFLGKAHVSQDKIVLSTRILCHFKIFDEVLKHEIAHFLQFIENGNKWRKKNNRNSFHGPDFKRQCKRLGIPARTIIPISKYESASLNP